MFRLILLTSILACTSLSFSAEMWGIGITTFSGNHVLAKFDSADPTVVDVIGPVVPSGLLWVGIEFDLQGNLYAFAATSNGTPIGLHLVNQATGAITLLGTPNLPPGVEIRDLALDPTTGVLYAVGGALGDVIIYTVSTLTGEVTLDTDLGVWEVFPDGLAIDGAGNRFILDTWQERMWYVCDGGLGPYDHLGVVTWFHQGMTIDWDGDGTWYHVAKTDPNDTGLLGPSRLPVFSQFRTVDPATGVTTLVDYFPLVDEFLAFGDIAIRPTQGNMVAVPLPDCDGNGLPDSCEIALDPSLDLDADQQLDSCQIAAGAPDCDGDGILDSSEFFVPTYIDSATRIANPTAGDFNEDGLMDLMVTESIVDTLRLHLGDGAGGFTPSTLIPVNTPSGYGFQVGDYNQDGHLDVFSLGFNTTVREVWLGDGAGGFTAGQSWLGVGSARLSTQGDFNDDGMLDLVISVRNSSGNDVLATHLGSPTGFTLSAIVNLGYRPASLGSGDLDGDGDLDVVAVRDTNQTIRAAYNNGNGSFVLGSTVAVGGAPWRLCVGDFIEDGIDDVIVLNPSQHTYTVVRGTATQGLQPELVQSWNTAHYPDSADTADYNGDGHLDLVIPMRQSNEVQILSGDGTGTFEIQHRIHAQNAPVDAIFTDFTGDGLLDAVAVEWGTERLVVIERIARDCNQNGLPDSCDIASGFSADDDGDGIPDECGSFVRGDCNDDGSYNIGDPVSLLDTLFGTGAIPNCADACDANDDSGTDIGDAVYMLTSLFSGGSPPLPPHQNCGMDPTADSLDCEFTSCL